MMIIYTSTTKKTCQTNRMLAIYAFFCDCQLFQVTFIPSLVPNWKTADWFSGLCSKWSQRIAMLLTPGHNQWCSISHSSSLNHPQCVCYGNHWRNMATKIRTDHSCETLSVDYNKRKIGFILPKQQKGKK